MRPDYLLVNIAQSTGIGMTHIAVLSVLLEQRQRLQELQVKQTVLVRKTNLELISDIVSFLSYFTSLQKQLNLNFEIQGIYTDSRNFI